MFRNFLLVFLYKLFWLRHDCGLYVELSIKDTVRLLSLRPQWNSAISEQASAERLRRHRKWAVLICSL